MELVEGLGDDDAQVEEFLSALKPGTAHVYKHGLEAFRRYLVEKAGLSLGVFLLEVAADSARPITQKTRVGRRVLNGFVKWLEAQKLAPKTVNNYVTAVQAYAQYFDVPLSLKYVNRPPVRAVHKKHPWTIEEVGRFVDFMGNIQYKCIAAVIVQSGLSISDVLSIKYGDIREEFERGVSPLCLDLTRIKTNVQFMTFIGRWALSLLRQHLKGQRLRDHMPVFNAARRTVDQYFQKTGERFGKFQGRNPYSPHSLRAAFNTILRDHKVDPVYVEFWMGHKVKEQQMVYVSKSREGWRETYRTQAEPWLTPPNVRV